MYRNEILRSACGFAQNDMHSSSDDELSVESLQFITHTFLMRVYLIRHAQSEENVLDFRAQTTISDFNELLRRSHAAPLTPTGEAQARALVERLAATRIERLYSSPFTRALSTATALGAALGLTPELVEELREVLPRPLSERNPASLRRMFLRSYAGMLWPGGADETWLMGYRRAKVGWARITADDAQEVAAVSHRALLSLVLLSLRRDRRWIIRARDLRNGGISVVERQTK